jgi:hypothetical protein
MREMLAGACCVAIGLIFLTAPAVGLPRAADAGTLTLEWASNRESDIAGYFVIYGTDPTELTSIVDVGNHTAYHFTNLESGRTYYFAVQAYNTTGLISSPSAAVSATIEIAPLSVTTLMTNLTPPRPVGTVVKFAAAASGGMAPYQYKWFVSDGVKSTVAKDWSSENTFSWQPLVANPNYAVKVSARSATNATEAADVDLTERTMSFGITAATTKTHPPIPAPCLFVAPTSPVCQ